jgi:ribosomal protein S12 methylthiotransferase accessory factor
MVDGAHRAGDLLQTWEQFEHHISPVTGVVDAFAPVCCDDLAHCYESTRYDTKPLGKPLDLLSTRDHTDWGKGIDPMQARVSALAETLERYSLMAERPADTTRAAMIELGAEAIDPRSLLHFSDAQYADHGASSSDVPHFERVPRDRFDPDQVIGWTAGRCLTDQRVCLVPSDYCWISPEATRDGAFCVPDTNGCAAGSHLEHAILQGLYELVERDSVALWWYNMARRPGVDLASFHDPEITAIRGHHRSPLGRELRVLDITSDIGIPVFAAISASAEVGRPEFVFGFGCHQNPAIALRGAVTELIQLLTVQKRFLTTPTNPDPWKNNRPLVARYIEDWLRRTRREDQPHLFPAEDEQPRSRADFQETCTRDLRQDLSWCVDRLHSLGIKVFVVDVTRPDIGLAVVRVMAPGLRHFWRRLGPGRLYDAPVALGWLDHPTAEHELNPISMFV